MCLHACVFACVFEPYITSAVKTEDLHLDLLGTIYNGHRRKKILHAGVSQRCGVIKTLNTIKAVNAFIL